MGQYWTWTVKQTKVTLLRCPLHFKEIGPSFDCTDRIYWSTVLNAANAKKTLLRVFVSELLCNNVSTKDKEHTNQAATTVSEKQQNYCSFPSHTSTSSFPFPIPPTVQETAPRTGPTSATQTGSWPGAHHGPAFPTIAFHCALDKPQRRSGTGFFSKEWFRRWGGEEWGGMSSVQWARYNELGTMSLLDPWKGKQRHGICASCSYAKWTTRIQ